MQAQSDAGHHSWKQSWKRKAPKKDGETGKFMTPVYEAWDLAKPEVYPLNFSHFVSQEVWFCLNSYEIVSCAVYKPSVLTNHFKFTYDHHVIFNF